LGIENVLVRAAPALLVIGIEQAAAGLPLHDRGQLPAEIVRVLNAAVAAAGAERADQMGAVAGEDHPARHEALHARAPECVDRAPFEVERGLADDGTNPRQHPFRLSLQLRVGARPELKIQAKDVVGLTMQERTFPAVKWRLEPE